MTYVIVWGSDLRVRDSGDNGARNDEDESYGERESEAKKGRRRPQWALGVTSLPIMMAPTTSH